MQIFFSGFQNLSQFSFSFSLHNLLYIKLIFFLSLNFSGHEDEDTVWAGRKTTFPKINQVKNCSFGPIICMVFHNEMQVSKGLFYHQILTMTINPNSKSLGKIWDQLQFCGSLCVGLVNMSCKYFSVVFKIFPNFLLAFLYPFHNFLSIQFDNFFELVNRVQFLSATLKF